MIQPPTPGRAAPAPKKLSIPRLRRLLLVVLTLATMGFTGGVYLLVQRIFQNFGPGVEEDLIWKTVRGAQELAHVADLGLAVKDAKMVTESLGDYRRSEDVMGISAEGAGSSRHSWNLEGFPASRPSIYMNGCQSLQFI